MTFPPFDPVDESAISRLKFRESLRLATRGQVDISAMLLVMRAPVLDLVLLAIVERA